MDCNILVNNNCESYFSQMFAYNELVSLMERDNLMGLMAALLQLLLVKDALGLPRLACT